MTIFKNNKQAMSLVELVVAAIIAVLIVLVGAALPTALKKAIRSAEEKYYAIDLASSQIEDLKQKAKIDFIGDPALSDTNTIGPTLYKMPTINQPENFDIDYTIEDAGWMEDGNLSDTDYKEAVVTVIYGANKHQIQLRTYITE